MNERAELAAIALRVAQEAAALLRRGYRSRPHADEKGRADLVTAFDRESEALILARLAELAPGIPVVGEEGTSEEASTRARDGRVFWVDPLDGTTNFVHGHPFFCVSIGLAEDDRPVAGAIVAPALGTSWLGVVGPGGGATRDDVPCAVSCTEDLERALLATGFPADRTRAPDDNFDAFVRVKRVCRGIRRCGSAALDLALVADGTYDGYWERRLHGWDVMAGAALVLAAGGRVTDLVGAAPVYSVGRIVASNGRVHGALLAQLRAS